MAIMLKNLYLCGGGRRRGRQQTFDFWRWSWCLLGIVVRGGHGDRPMGYRFHQAAFLKTQACERSSVGTFPLSTHDARRLLAYKKKKNGDDNDDIERLPRADHSVPTDPKRGPTKRPWKPWDKTLYYDEQRPRRSGGSYFLDNQHDAMEPIFSDSPPIVYNRGTLPTTASNERGRNMIRHQDSSWKEVWGIHQSAEAVFRPDLFPSTLQTIAEAAAHAVAATLYGQQRLDPNVVNNALYGDQLLGRRPTRQAWDAGRMGLEISGVHHLTRGGLDSESHAAAVLRRVALLIARQLSQWPWPDYENNPDDDRTPDFHGAESSPTRSTSRPVTVYMNQINQALFASRELKLLKRLELHDTAATTTSFDQITIRCLGHDSLVGNENKVSSPAADAASVVDPDGNHRCRDPQVSNRPKRRGRKARVPIQPEQLLSADLAQGRVDPRRGIILVVQPTDYNQEFLPPGPVIGAVDHIQRLVVQASVQGRPVVLISPRFLATLDSGTSLASGWDQSGYHQSAPYGGREPPRGPTPWIMRDFSPPVFSWIGDAAATGREPRRVRGHEEYGPPTRLALIQSVLHPGHVWHLYAASNNHSQVNPPAGGEEYRYVASTQSSSGRPTREILLRMLAEYP